MTCLNIYATKQGALKYIKHPLTKFKGETDQNTNIVGDHNIPLLALHRLSKQKTNREI